MPAPYRIADETYAIPILRHAPPFGIAHFNSFLIRGRESILVDTGALKEHDEWQQHLWSLVDPKDLHWVLLTHDDREHAGNLMYVLEKCPRAKVVMNWFSFLRLADDNLDIPMDRMHLVNSGESVNIGGRGFGVLRPPLFDSPATVGFFDLQTGVYFSADCFGSPTPTFVEDVADAPKESVRRNFYAFNRANEPWCQYVDTRKYTAELEKVRKLDARVLASGHAPAARGDSIPWFLELMADLPAMEPFEGLTQADFEKRRPLAR
ncbi:MAG TPA: MBL fold metallo-hydrolase [Archangium sp.]|jgi:flavorubredoxin|uniref:MBL fold metallo-hydrolase n=1 Tax=Archangium sp. TaxID=1872627 RepID=UPI002ED7B9B9